MEDITVVLKIWWNVYEYDEICYMLSWSVFMCKNCPWWKHTYCTWLTCPVCRMWNMSHMGMAMFQVYWPKLILPILFKERLYLKNTLFLKVVCWFMERVKSSHYVDQAGFEITEICLPAFCSRVLGFKGVSHCAQPTFNCVSVCLSVCLSVNTSATVLVWRSKASLSESILTLYI